MLTHNTFTYIYAHTAEIYKTAHAQMEQRKMMMMMMMTGQWSPVNKEFDKSFERFVIFFSFGI